MGKGIQIKKPDHLASSTDIPAAQPIPTTLPVFFYVMLGLTFPAALFALYFFIQTRNA